MSLFQHSVIKRHLRKLDKEKVEEAWQKFTAHFHNSAIQANIRKAKEEQYQEGFFRDLFVNVLGYTLNPDVNFNLTTELKNIKNAKKADGAILKDKYALAVIELKGMKIVSLNKAEEQAFGYKNNQPKCVYVITSNFGKLRFYIDNAVDFEEFNLFQLTKERFEVLYLCLCARNLLKDLPKRMKEESVTAEEDITKKLYADYSLFRKMLFENIVENNPTYDKLTLFKKTQKLLDRFLFVFFAEDTGLVAPNTTRTILQQWSDLRLIYDVHVSLYHRFQKYFNYLNKGYNGQTFQVFAYNGGLFEPDDILDSLKINDEALHEHTFKLSKYDFASEVSVNILGHIFEHSLTEIEEIQAELAGQKRNKNKGKRKKDGIFYTPSYITKYIIENTVGKLCKEKKAELGILETEEEGITENSIDLENIKTYRKWLLSLTICDPACGSGAFLNQALEFLIAEHQYIDELQAAALGETMVSNEIENAILENNLFGVDINQESVEIAKLSLWLRTAKEGRKLTFLNENIKRGNSLIDDAEVAGDSAFVWEKEFPQVFENGGFDVVIGNPPYLRIQGLIEAYPLLTLFYENNFTTATGNYDIYILFMEKAYDLINSKGEVSFILPHKFLISEYGKGIRKFLSEKKAVNSILHFQENLVFAVTTYTCIINLDKKKNDVLKFKYLNPKNIADAFSWDTINTDTLSSDKWNLMSNKKIQLFEKLAQQPFTVKDIFAKIFTGLQTSADNIYLIDGKAKGNIIEGYSKSLNKIVEIEKAFVKPLLKGKDVSKYKKMYNQYFVLFPYLFEEKEDEEGKKAVGMTEEYIENHFPKAYEYLKANEKALRARERGKMDKATWFLYIYPKSLTAFDQPKIITPEISLGTNMSFDEGVMYHSTTIYSFILKEPSIETYKYYLAILNSNLLWFYLMNTGTVLRGGYFRFKTKYLFPFPLPKIPENQAIFIEKSDKMLLLHNDFQKQKKAFLKVLQASFELPKLSKKLQHWYKLSPAEFLKELQKKKIKLSLKQKSEWLAYFEEEKVVVEKVLQQIAKTDKEIDKMVYELYDLTKEEIKMVGEVV